MRTQAIDRNALSRIAVLGVGLLLGAGCSSDLSPVTGCEPGFGIDVDCQFQNPEDLALAPDGRILVSQFGDMEGARPGSLAAYDPASRSLAVLFPSPDSAPAAAASEWGDSACAPPDVGLFSPHGIDTAKAAPTGLSHSLRVKHPQGGASRSILFRIVRRLRRSRGADSQFSPGRFFILRRPGPVRQASGDADGPAGGMPFSLVKALLGSDTGWIYAWSPAGGFAKIPGTDAPMPNGIEKSEDERYAYLNVYGSGGVRKIDVTTGETVARADLDPVDNSTWGEDGRLLVAAHTGGLGEMLACQGLEEGSCGMPFEIVALDPDDLSQQVLIAHEARHGVSQSRCSRERLVLPGTSPGRIGIVDLSIARRRAGLAVSLRCPFASELRTIALLPAAA